MSRHEGAVYSSFAVGDRENVKTYSEYVFSNAHFEDTLETQKHVISSLALAGEHKDCISKGVDLLRKLGFGIPEQPSKDDTMNALATMNEAVSLYSLDQIVSLSDTTPSKSVHNIIKIMDSFHRSCLSLMSPFCEFSSTDYIKNIIAYQKF